MINRTAAFWQKKIKVLPRVVISLQLLCVAESIFEWVISISSKTSETYSELGGSCRSPMETEHDNLQTMTAIGSFEEAWLQQVRGHCRRQVYPPICQTVTVKRKHMREFYRSLCQVFQTSYTLIHKKKQNHLSHRATEKVYVRKRFTHIG